MSILSQEYPKACLTFSGFGAGDESLIKKFVDLGGDEANPLLRGRVGIKATEPVANRANRPDGPRVINSIG